MIAWHSFTRTTCGHLDCIQKAPIVIMPSSQSHQEEDQHSAGEIEQQHKEEQSVPMYQSRPRQVGTNGEGTDLKSTLQRMERKMETINESISRTNASFRYSMVVLEDLAVRVKGMEARDRGKGNLQPATAHTCMQPPQPEPASQVLRAQSPQPSSSGIPATAKDCVFCGGRHWATNCERFTTLTARRNRVYELQRCERCLTPNKHLVTACSAKSSCFYCKRANRSTEMTKHHSAFCVYQFEM
ncbi:hypothetical protein Y032_0093g2673 [Ancylostoma ceylanicum]|uniref:Uncharacterized protein n=1 Tax=Ancylostoma ceylanicum TaxID=53326 RepID=A0A016TLN0_9BILA|nr:hypothetical protein Y032_0093g2673 [Ancylostoma ceylanicum]